MHIAAAIPVNLTLLCLPLLHFLPLFSGKMGQNKVKAQNPTQRFPSSDWSKLDF